MFAVISYQGNQYKVEIDREYQIQSKEVTAEKMVFDEVLLIESDKGVSVGTPTVKGASVEAEVLGLSRGDKVTGTKFRPKKRYQRTLGHVQDYVLVKITSINS
jgi:large subunit ribosomal protein L21